MGKKLLGRVGSLRSDERKVQATCVVLRRYIRENCKEGDALASVRQLAGELEISFSVVCGALRQLALAGILEVNHGSRTRVTAAALRVRVGILTPLNLTHPRTSGYHQMLMYHLVEEMDRLGVDVSFYCGFNKPWVFGHKRIPWNFVNDVHCGHLDGVIVFSDVGTVGLDVCESLSIPVVGIGSDYSAYACFDVMDVTRVGVRSLLGAGCRRLAMISWDGGGCRTIFERAVRRRKLEIVPQWVCAGFQTIRHPTLLGAGEEAFGKIWDALDKKPDGLLITDAAYMPEVVTAIQKRGICVPAELKIAAHSHKTEASFPVTLLMNDPERQARELTEVLLVKLGLRPQNLSTQRVLRCTVRENQGGTGLLACAQKMY